MFRVRSLLLFSRFGWKELRLFDISLLMLQLDTGVYIERFVAYKVVFVVLAIFFPQPEKKLNKVVAFDVFSD